MLSDWAILPFAAIIVASVVYYLALRRRGYGDLAASLYALPLILAGVATIWLLDGFAATP